MPIRYTIKDMQGIAREHGGKCLSKEYIDVHDLLAWMCKKGHTWDSPYSIIRQGGWCVQCAKKEDQLEELQKIAKKRGGKCLSKEYITGLTKLEWQCSKGHKWKAIPKSIKIGNWCPTCAGKRYTIVDMKALASAHGGKCLSLRYASIKTKLKWQCKEGHIWMSTPLVIKHSGGWCPKCAVIKNADRMRGNINDCIEMAVKHGGKLLSEIYINSHTHLNWQCDKGHEWMATPVSVKSGHWCIVCGRARAGEKRRTDINIYKKLAVKKGGVLLSEKYISNRQHLEWQCSKGHKWKASAHTIKNGSWCPKCSGHARLTLEEMQELARKRGGKCLSISFVNGLAPLKWECQKGHTWMAPATRIKFGAWCPHCGGTAKLSIDEMRDLAREKGGKCLSKEYINNRTKLKWQCGKGHIWMTKPNGIRSGNWCPECATIKNANNHRGNIEKYSVVAENRGGILISKKYLGANTYLRWQCKKGHQWRAKPGAVKFGSWCPVCSGHLYSPNIIRSSV